MRKITHLAAMMLLCVPVYADCPLTVRCKIDGEAMGVEETYSNGLHVSKKYGHDYDGPNGKEHHYVIVQCQ